MVIANAKLAVLTNSSVRIHLDLNLCLVTLATFL